MKKFIRFLFSFLPTALPVGMTEFNSWLDDIISLSKVPDNDSTRFAAAVMIFNLKPDQDRKSKRYFIKALNKGAANECANAIAMGFKEKQKAAAAEEQAKKLQDKLGSNTIEASSGKSAFERL